MIPSHHASHHDDTSDAAWRPWWMFRGHPGVTCNETLTTTCTQQSPTGITEKVAQQKIISPLNLNVVVEWRVSLAWKLLHIYHEPVWDPQTAAGRRPDV